jgi:hypothetical protein
MAAVPIQNGRNSLGLFAVILAKPSHSRWMYLFQALSVDISKETAIEQIKEFKTHRFLNAPVPTSAMWESVFLTDVSILLHSQIQANREMWQVWKGFVERLPLLLPDRPAATVCKCHGVTICDAIVVQSAMQLECHGVTICDAIVVPSPVVPSS